jgi:putative transposase
MPNNSYQYHHPFNLARARRSIRLYGYDYSTPGGYFITIATQRRNCLFGEIAGGEMRLNELGEIARAEWLKTAALRPEIALDEFVIMPNHMHAIVIIADIENGFVGARHRRAPTATEPFGRPVPGSIPTIIRAYKSAVTYHINQIRHTPGTTVWQRNYYEHIIRDPDDLSQIREYICSNPIRWELDLDHPSAK